MSKVQNLNLVEFASVLDHLAELEALGRRTAEENEDFYKGVVKNLNTDRHLRREPSASSLHPPYEMVSTLFDPINSYRFTDGHVTNGVSALKKNTDLSLDEINQLPAEFVYAVGAAESFAKTYDDKNKPGESFEARLRDQSKTLKQAIISGVQSERGQLILKSVAIAASVYTGGIVAKGAILGFKELSKALSKNEKFKETSDSLISGAKSFMQKAYKVVPFDLRQGIKSALENKTVQVALGVAAVVVAAVVLSDISAVSDVIGHSADAVADTLREGKAFLDATPMTPELAAGVIFSGVIATAGVGFGVGSVITKVTTHMELKRDEKMWRDELCLSGAELDDYLKKTLKSGDKAIDKKNDSPTLG
jgi:hypothetical protein